MNEVFACMVKRKVHTEFWWGNLGEIEHFENLGSDKKVILKWVFKKFFGRCVDWIDLAQDNLTWWAVMNKITKLWVLSIAGKFLTS